MTLPHNEVGRPPWRGHSCLCPSLCTNFQHGAARVPNSALGSPPPCWQPSQQAPRTVLRPQRPPIHPWMDARPRSATPAAPAAPAGIAEDQASSPHAATVASPELISNPQDTPLPQASLSRAAVLARLQRMKSKSGSEPPRRPPNNNHVSGKADALNPQQHSPTLAGRHVHSSSWLLPRADTQHSGKASATKSTLDTLDQDTHHAPTALDNSAHLSSPEQQAGPMQPFNTASATELRLRKAPSEPTTPVVGQPGGSAAAGRSGGLSPGPGISTTDRVQECEMSGEKARLNPVYRMIRKKQLQMAKRAIYQPDPAHWLESTQPWPPATPATPDPLLAGTQSQAQPEQSSASPPTPLSSAPAVRWTNLKGPSKPAALAPPADTAPAVQECEMASEGAWRNPVYRLIRKTELQIKKGAPKVPPPSGVLLTWDEPLPALQPPADSPTPGLASLFSLSNSLLSDSEINWADPSSSLAASLDPGLGSPAARDEVDQAPFQARAPDMAGMMRPWEKPRSAPQARGRGASSPAANQSAAPVTQPDWVSLFVEDSTRPAPPHVPAPPPASVLPPPPPSEPLLVTPISINNTPQTAADDQWPLPSFPSTGHAGVDRAIRIRQLSLSQRRKKQLAKEQAQKAGQLQFGTHGLYAAARPRHSSPPHTDMLADDQQQEGLLDGEQQAPCSLEQQADAGPNLVLHTNFITPSPAGVQEMSSPALPCSTSSTSTTPNVIDFTCEQEAPVSSNTQDDTTSDSPTGAAVPEVPGLPLSLRRLNGYVRCTGDEEQSRVKRVRKQPDAVLSQRAVECLVELLGLEPDWQGRQGDEEVRQESKVSAMSKVRQLLRRQPNLLLRSVESLTQNLTFLHLMLGVPRPRAVEAVLRYPSLLELAPATVWRNYNHLLTLTRTHCPSVRPLDVTQAVCECPALLAMAPASLTARLKALAAIGSPLPADQIQADCDLESQPSPAAESVMAVEDSAGMERALRVLLAFPGLARVSSQVIDAKRRRLQAAGQKLPSWGRELHTMSPAYLGRCLSVSSSVLDRLDYLTLKVSETPEGRAGAASHLSQHSTLGRMSPGLHWNTVLGMRLGADAVQDKMMVELHDQMSAGRVPAFGSVLLMTAAKFSERFPGFAKWQACRAVSSTAR